MSHDGLASHCHDAENNTLDSLIAEYEDIQSDINFIKHIDVSEQSKLPILTELYTQVNEIKERMHDCISHI